MTALIDLVADLRHRIQDYPTATAEQCEAQADALVYCDNLRQCVVDMVDEQKTESG